MSIQKVLASELDIREYVAQLGLNPDNVFYQSVSARNISPSNAQWTITSPNKRSYLLSYAVVNWMPTIELRREDNATARNWGVINPAVSFKPGLAFANAMSSVTLSVNGTTLTLSQPRRFMEGLTMSNVNAEECAKCFESGYPESMGGIVPVNRPGLFNLELDPDKQFARNEQNFDNKLLRAQGVNAYGAFSSTALSGNNGIQEPLIVPPFNPFAKLKSGMPSYSWFSKMSDVIPNIDRLELDIQFQNLAASLMYFRYYQALINNNEEGNLAVTSLAADLKLYWYEVPVNTSIPRSVDLNTWNVREYIKNFTAVRAPQAAEPTIQSDLIQLNSTPTLIMIHAEYNKDSVLYRSRAAAQDDDLSGANPKKVSSSWDAMPEITSLEILLGDRPNVISTNFTQKELYYLTQKNSKAPFPYTFNDWRGKARWSLANGGALAPAAYNTDASKCIALIRPKDIAEKISDGVFAPNSFQVSANFTPHQGTHGNAPANALQYTFYVHLFYGKHFLRIEPDKAQFQEQSIPLDTARRLTNPVLESQGVSGLGSPLEGLRLRDEGGAFPNIQSRV